MSTERRIPAARFKAECLALLDRVADTGEELVVTKRGRAVVRVVPVASSETVSTPRGSVEVLGDVTAPIDEAWQAAAPRPRRAARRR